MMLFQNPVRTDAIDLQVLPGGRASPPFQRRPGVTGAKVAKLLFNGADTGLRLPIDWHIQTLGVTRNGELAGNLSESFSGAYSGQNSIGFVTTGHHFHLLVPPKGYLDSIVQSLSPEGDVVGIWGFTSTFGNPDQPYEHVSHGFVLSNGKTTDIGAAETVKWISSGVLRGTAPVEASTQRHVGVIFGQQKAIETFRWSNGKRTILSISRVHK